MDVRYKKLEEFGTVRLYYEAALKELETKLNIINDEFNMLKGINPINHIKSRMKSVFSVVEKLERKGLEVNVDNTFLLTDIVGARIVCNFIDDIYTVIEKIKSNKVINIVCEKDYINNPKKSGYRGYHIIVAIPITINDVGKDIYAEIQIRTSAMDFWASSEHRLNYKKKGLGDNDKEELKRLSNSLWDIDVSMNEMSRKNLVSGHVDISAKIKKIQGGMRKEILS